MRLTSGSWSSMFCLRPANTNRMTFIYVIRTAHCWKPRPVTVQPMPVRPANTRQARCSCTSGPAPWNPCHHLGDIDAVVPGPDHGLEPTRRDDAGVHIDPGVRVDKGLITFHHERLEERNGVSAVATPSTKSTAFSRARRS